MEEVENSGAAVPADARRRRVLKEIMKERTNDGMDLAAYVVRR